MNNSRIFVHTFLPIMLGVFGFLTPSNLHAEGVVNGSFSEPSNGVWKYTRYLKENSSSPSDVFDFKVSIQSEMGRNAFVRLNMDQFNPEGSDPTFAKDYFPELIQQGITLSCPSRLIILEFDYRSQGSLAYYGLESELVARRADEGMVTTTFSSWLGRSNSDDSIDGHFGWTTAQMALEIPEDVDPVGLVYEVKFTVLFQNTRQSSTCAPEYPIVDLDEISVRSVDTLGDLPQLETTPIGCNADFDAGMAVSVELDDLITSSVVEPRIERNYRYRRAINSHCYDVDGHHGCLIESDSFEQFYTPAGSSCLGDLNHDGIVNGADMTLLLAAWGSGDSSFETDLNGDCMVDGADLTILLANWGRCGPKKGAVLIPRIG